MRAARENLEGTMAEDVCRLLDSCRYGVLRNLVLPTAWEHAKISAPLRLRTIDRIHVNASTITRGIMGQAHKDHGRAKSGSGDADPIWWSSRGALEATSREKTIGSFWHVRPELTAIDKGMAAGLAPFIGKTGMCVPKISDAHQLRKKCRWTHIPSSQLTKEVFEAINEKIKLAYRSTWKRGATPRQTGLEEP